MLNLHSSLCNMQHDSDTQQKEACSTKKQHIQFILPSVVSSSNQDFMRQAGEVTYADAHKGRANEGVIEFRSRSDLKRALEKLDGTDINGRKIRLVEDKHRRRRSYSGSRSRSIRLRI